MGCGASSSPPVAETSHPPSKKIVHNAEKLVMDALEGKPASDKPKKDKKSRLVNEGFFTGEFENFTDECKKLMIESQMKRKECKKHAAELKNCLIVMTGRNIYTDGIPITKDNKNLQPLEKIAASLSASVSIETVPEILTKVKAHGVTDLHATWNSERLAQAEKDLIVADSPKALEAKVTLQGFSEAFLQNNLVLKLIPLEKKSLVLPELSLWKQSSFEKNASLEKVHIANDKYWVFYSVLSESQQLSDFVKVSFMENELAQIAKQVLESLKSLHAKQYIHRDLRPENVMMNNDGEIVLCNINLGDETIHTKEYYYMPPEVLLNAGCTPKSDIWHLGCFMLELMEGNAPRHKYAPLKAMMRTAVSGSPKLKNPTLWTATILEFLRKCFVLDPEKRPGPAELLNDDFIAKALPKEEFAKKIHGWRTSMADRSKTPPL